MKDARKKRKKQKNQLHSDAIHPEGVARAMQSARSEIAIALRASIRGLSSHVLTFEENVTFILDNHQEVKLTVHRVIVEYSQKEGEEEKIAKSLRVICRTDFKNVLILAQKINMKMRDFHTHYTVILSAHPDFLEAFNQEIVELNKVDKFFETLDAIKRPIFLNLNHYIVARISD